VHVLVWLFWPPPQVTVHDDHGDQSEKPPSIGQGCVLHLLLSFVGPTHDSSLQKRSLVWIPPLHDNEHDDHGTHRVNLSSSADRMHLQSLLMFASSNPITEHLIPDSFKFI